MKAINAKAMTEDGIAEALSTSTEMKKSVCGQILNSLAEIATQEMKSTGVFTIPGVCKIKTRMKPATKAGKREVFGKVVMVKAKPARKVVKMMEVATPAWRQYQEHVICMIHTTPRATLGDNTLNSFDSF